MSEEARNWQPIAAYNFQRAEPVWLRDRNGREMFGMWDRKLFDYDEDGRLVELHVSVMQWGSLVDGGFHPAPSFEPVEFATVPEEEMIAMIIE